LISPSDSTISISSVTTKLSSSTTAGAAEVSSAASLLASAAGAVATGGGGLSDLGLGCSSFCCAGVGDGLLLPLGLFCDSNHSLRLREFSSSPPLPLDSLGESKREGRVLRDGGGGLRRGLLRGLRSLLPGAGAAGGAPIPISCPFSSNMTDV